MAITYRIYSNRGTGGVVDFSSPIAITADLSYPGIQVGISSDTTFVVRTYDTITGLEQAGSEAQCRVMIGADGENVAGLANAPQSIVLSPAIGGAARVNWAYVPAIPWGRPNSFQVFVTKGSQIDLSVVAATVPFSPTRMGYSCILPGPFDGSMYLAGVRPINSVGAGRIAVSGLVSIGAISPFVMDPVKVAVG